MSRVKSANSKPVKFRIEIGENEYECNAEAVYTPNEGGDGRGYWEQSDYEFDNYKKNGRMETHIPKGIRDIFMDMAELYNGWEPKEQEER